MRLPFSAMVLASEHGFLRKLGECMLRVSTWKTLNEHLTILVTEAALHHPKSSKPKELH